MYSRNAFKWISLVSKHYTSQNYKLTAKKPLKPRLNLLRDILQRPLTPRLLTPHAINLRLCKPLRLRRRIVPQPIQLTNSLIALILRRTPISPLVHCDNDRTAQTEVVLQRDLGVLDTAVVRPAAQVPDQLCALGDPVAPSGWPLEISPPEGLMTTLSAVGDVTAADHLVGLSRLAEPKRVNE